MLFNNFSKYIRVVKLYRKTPFNKDYDKIEKKKCNKVERNDTTIIYRTFIDDKNFRSRALPHKRKNNPRFPFLAAVYHRESTRIGAFES